MDVEGLQNQMAYQRRLAKDVEDESEKKINAARDRVKQATVESEGEINHIRDDYSRRAEGERIRTEGSMEALQTKSYEGLRDQKRRADGEQAKIRKESEKEILNLKTLQEVDRNQIDVHSKKELQDLIQRNATMKDFQEKSGKEVIHDIQTKQNAEIEIRTMNHNQALNGLTNESKVQQEALRAATGRSLQEANEHYGETFSRTLSEQDKSLTKLGKETKNQLDELKLKTEHRLAQYNARQNDPFYKLVDLGMKLHEDKDAFTLTAIVPEHEQKRIQVVVRGNELVLSGQRKNQEKLDLGEGRSRSTSSYQSFHESLPLNYPVEEKMLTRRFEGDLLIVEIPKKKTSYDPSQMPATRGKLSREATVLAVRPEFPENIPGEKALAEKIKTSNV